MINYLTKKIIPLMLMLLAMFAVPVMASVPAYADAKDDICQGLAAGSGCSPAADNDVNRVIRLAINIFSWVVGIVAVIMIIVGGFKYVISSGDSANVNSAKNTILYALVGLVIVALAQIIVRFVLDKAK